MALVVTMLGAGIRARMENNKTKRLRKQAREEGQQFLEHALSLDDQWIQQTTKYALILRDQWSKDQRRKDESHKSRLTVVKSESHHPPSHSSSSRFESSLPSPLPSPFQPESQTHPAPVNPISKDQTEPALIQKLPHPLCSTGILKSSVWRWRLASGNPASPGKRHSTREASDRIKNNGTQSAEHGFLPACIPKIDPFETVFSVYYGQSAFLPVVDMLKWAKAADYYLIRLR